MLGRLLKRALLVLFVSVMQILHRYFVVVLEPIHDERLEPRTIVGHIVLLYGAHVLIVEQSNAKV